MPRPRDGAVRRFALLWTVGTLWKVAALATFLVIALKVGGGNGW